MRRSTLAAVLGAVAALLALPAAASAIDYSGSSWRQAEGLRYGSPKRIVSHSGAVGNQAMGLLHQNSFAGDYVYLSGPADTLKVRLRTTSCDGSPWLGVYLYRHDGSRWRAPVDTWFRLDVRSYASRDLAISAPSAGWYFVYFTMPYDAYKPGVCDRNVYLDQFVFVDY